MELKKKKKKKKKISMYYSTDSVSLQQSSSITEYDSLKDENQFNVDIPQILPPDQVWLRIGPMA